MDAQRHSIHGFLAMKSLAALRLLLPVPCLVARARPLTLTWSPPISNTAKPCPFSPRALHVPRDIIWYFAPCMHPRLRSSGRSTHRSSFLNRCRAQKCITKKMPMRINPMTTRDTTMTRAFTMNNWKIIRACWPVATSDAQNGAPGDSGEI